MKLITLKPLYLGGKTLVEGSPFITDEQHGRQLLAKGFAAEHEGDELPEVDLTSDQAGGGAFTTESLIGKSKPFDVKQLGHGHWIVVNAEGQQVGDFSGNKAAAIAEVERLTAEAAPQV
ncbi:hypothetical protein KKQ10_24735 [Pseudomonas sp. MG-9]|uniref:hypothetical protein n=1 Tax=Pseudomonas sp. MG-9 TaxID=2839032 RepID=UPI001C0002F6|nr:hypothetical protein [Pseudomonas sp. MG-9]MBT9268087.1 hypothetical protein [Pseudomonas sp. MG-9]